MGAYFCATRVTLQEMSLMLLIRNEILKRRNAHFHFQMKASASEANFTLNDLQHAWKRTHLQTNIKIRAFHALDPNPIDLLLAVSAVDLCKNI